MKVYKIISAIGQWIWQLRRLAYLRRMKVLFKDNGDIIIASGNEELVTKMRENSHDQAKNNKDYMMNYSRRAVISNNEDIRATDESDFIKDLLRLKHLELV